MADNTVAVERWETDARPLQSPGPTYRSSATGRLVSYTRPGPGISVTTFLDQARGMERFFWEDVRGGITFAGFGVAVNLMAWGPDRFRHIQTQAEALFGDAVLLAAPPPPAAPRLFGGFAFRDDFVPDNTWAVFHPAHFVLPHYQFVQRDGTSWLTINVLLPPDEDPAGAETQLRAALDARYRMLRAAVPPDNLSVPHAPPTNMSYPMTRAAWGTMIDEARAQINTTELQKVVLARVAELRFPKRVNVDRALAYLNVHYGDCYRFLFEPRPFHAFCGATPELLANVDGARLTSMALAGSIGRSADPDADRALAQQLLHSAKDRHEHDVVVRSLAKRLAPLTSELEMAPRPGVVKLRNIQHLLTLVHGRLSRPGGVLPVVRALHPTPALGGSPRQLALAFIRHAEPVPRGWYAAPIGWIDYKLDGAFAVAIRSAVSQERRVWLYAGAGIVADSDPQQEWDETALKFRPMLRALGVTTAKE